MTTDNEDDLIACGSVWREATLVVTHTCNPHFI